MKYTRQIASGLYDDAWDNFVLSHPSGTHLQSSAWARLKSLAGWRPVRVTLMDGGRTVAGAQLLVRSVPILGSYMYLPKGPLFASDDPQLMPEMLDAIHAVGRKHRALMITIQPPHDGQALEAFLPQLGYARSRIELAPTATIVLDLSPDRESILKSMKRQSRQNILRSQREGMRVRLGSRSDLAAFYSLYKAVGHRRQAIPYTLKYFEQMWDVLAPSGNIALVIAEYQDIPVSALMLIAYKDTVVAKSFGWSGVEAPRRPNDAVFWGAMEWAKSQGYRFFDFEGLNREMARLLISGEPLPDSFRHSPAFFKVGFGGRVVLYPLSYEYLPNPLIRTFYNLVNRQGSRWSIRKAARKTVLRKEFGRRE